MEYLKTFEQYENTVKDLYGYDYKIRSMKNPYIYIIKTYNGEKLENEEKIYLDKPDLTTFDDDVPFTLGSNQILEFIQ